eukprot:CCRYP_013846-RA/>CCRYP_013846-RA protein AED:0.89 eAED:0.89 QI:0/0/0/0.5/1/1/2/0/334
MGKHATTLPFPLLSQTAAAADSFDDFPTSLMSVGKTSDDGTISIFTKDGVTIHKEQDVLITSKSPTGPTSDEVQAPASTIDSDSEALKPAASTNSLTQSGDMSEKQPDTDNTVRDLPIDDLETPGLQIPRIPTEEECQEASDDEFRTQFYSNLEKRLAESRENSQNFRPLFKTKAEALETIRLIEDWNAFTSDGKKRKRCAHTRHQYRLREKFELAIGSGTNCLRHRQTGCRVAIYEDLFDVIRDAHVGMGHARTARNILLELKNSWFGITAADVQLVIDLCPTCIGNTSRIKTSQTPLKMLFSPTIGHRAQVDLVDMTSNETEDGFKWIVALS